MRRTPLFIAAALAAAIAFAACGDDNQSSCGPGTVLQNGECVPVQTTSTNDPDTSSQTSQPDATNQTQTSQPDTTQPDTTGPCTPDEASTRIVGAPCTKDCQCDQDLGLYCYSGIYLQGFQFCTRDTQGPLSTAVNPSVVLSSSCDAIDSGHAEANDRKYVLACEDLDDCHEVASAYTHCGTMHFPWSNTETEQTQCPRTDSGGALDNQTMHLGNTCIIDSLPPFVVPE